MKRLLILLLGLSAILQAQNTGDVFQWTGQRGQFLPLKALNFNTGINASSTTFWAGNNKWLTPAGGGVFKWSLTGQALVQDSLRFIQGSNITLTQSGNTLTIA